MLASAPPISMFLVRHGTIPEVVKAVWAESGSLERGELVVIHTHRGTGLGMVLEEMRPSSEPKLQETTPGSEILRRATSADLEQARQWQEQCHQEFSTWEERIVTWGLDLQLIDLERTLDGAKIVLFVLNERGPECTKLALQAAAAGLGVIEVQPVSLEGVVTLPSGGGGCGSCGAH